eukprot:gene10293-15828_t
MSLKELMQALLSGENSVRNDAEKALEEAKKTPDALLAGLCDLMHNTNGAERQMAASCFRSTVTDSSIWEQLSDAAKQGMQPVLLNLLMVVEETAARRSIEMAVSTIGCRQLSKAGWPDLLPALFQAATKGDEKQQISAMGILTSMAASIDTHVNQIGEALSACLNSQSLPVRLAAVKSFTTCVSTFDEIKSYVALLPLILNTLAMCIPDHEQAADEILGGLTEVIEAQSDFLVGSGQLLPLLEFSYSIVANDKLAEPVRQRATELILTFIESDPKFAK